MKPREVIGAACAATAMALVGSSAFEGISTWLKRLDRFAQVVERTKGDR